jgi:hypothetical protein
MKRHYLLIVFLLLGSATANGADSQAAFSRLKLLVGEWETEGSMGKVHVSYELIAGGTALVERDSGDKMSPMLTVYYLDGDRLLLTHYCMAGNQPRMLAKHFDTATGELDFQFLDATNLPDPNAGHMRNAKLRVVDDHHYTAEWQFYENGKLKMSEIEQYTRIR